MGNWLCCRRNPPTVINVVNNYHVVEAAAAVPHIEQDQPAPAVDIVDDFFDDFEEFNYIVDSGATNDLGDTEHWSEHLERIIRADAAVLGWRHLFGVVWRLAEAIRRNRGRSWSTLGRYLQALKLFDAVEDRHRRELRRRWAQLGHQLRRR